MSSELGPPPEPLSASALARITDQLTAELPRTSGSRGEQILGRLTVAAVACVPGAEYAGLTMRRGGVLVSRAPSDPRIIDVDMLQVTLAEGPCVDAIAPGTDMITVVGDFAGESRWSSFSPAAAAYGIRSLLSFAMSPLRASPGALNLYSTRPHAFDDADRIVGAIFAQQAAIAVYGAEAIVSLERAVETRDEIGQAKGILMERRGLTAQQAFDLLVESSQQTNTKLVDVAHWLVNETGTRRRLADRNSRNASRGRPGRPDASA